MKRIHDLLSLSIDKNSREPIYQQIVDQIARKIEKGDLSAGDRLPPVRILSRAIGVNQMTVAKAYKSLATRGMVEGRTGGGTSVRESTPRSPKQIKKQVAERFTEGFGRWDIQSRIAELARAPGVIAFTGGCPGPSEADTESFLAAISDLSKGDARWLFAYSPSAGLPELRKGFSTLLGEQEIEVDPDDVIVTSGAQQGIDLVGRALVRPGDVVLVERPCYFGALDIFRSIGANIVDVPMQDDGIDVRLLEEALRRHDVKLIYLVPTFHNPTGITMSLEKRRTVLDLAKRYGVPILEDEYCPEIRYEGDRLPSLRQMAKDGESVIYIRGLSKVYLPGIRIGFALATPALRSRLLLTKSLADLHTSTILQKAVSDYLVMGSHRRHATQMRELYTRRQRLLIDRLIKKLPAEAEFKRPQGGFNLWISAPRQVRLSDYYFLAVQNGIAFTIGDLFFAGAPEGAALRISFGGLDEAALKSGADRISALVGGLLSPSAMTPQPVLV